MPGQSSFWVNRLRRLRDRFAAASPLAGTMPEWPSVPTGAPGEHHLGVDERAWKQLVSASPAVPFPIVGECRFEFENAFWNGIYYDGSANLGDSQARLDELNAGHGEFQTLAQAAARHFSMAWKEKLEWAKLIGRNPANAWLPAVCQHAGVTRYEDKAMNLIVHCGDVITASARAIEVLAETDGRLGPASTNTTTIA